MRSRAFTLALVVVAVLAGCTENPTTSARRRATPPAGPRTDLIQPSGTLDQNIQYLIGALFPTGLEDAAGDRWDGVKDKYAAGATDPSQMQVAKSMVGNLITWVLQKESKMSSAGLVGNETVPSAATRLAQYMALYVYGNLGPNTAVPPYFPGQDAAFGIVTPSAGGTIVTPTQHAGVKVDPSSVGQNTIITVTQNPNSYPYDCTGPLDTPFCQVPQFYSFDSYPHVPFLQKVHVAVCPVNVPTSLRSLLSGENDDQLRLAHPAPAGGPFTPGGAVLGNIEVLPLIAQSFVSCNSSTGATNSIYTLPTPQSSQIGMLLNGAARFFDRFASAVGAIVGPEYAKAIDQGGGGDVLTFSPFNVVDTVYRPHFSIQSFSVAPSPEGTFDGPPYVAPGQTVYIGYTVSNAGTAPTGSAASLAFMFGPDTTLTQPVVNGIGTSTTPYIAPGTSASQSLIAVTVPSNTAPGTYYIGAVVSSTGYPDGSGGNKYMSVQITVVTPPQ